MKTRILSIIAVLALSFSVAAQIDRSVQPKPGPAPKVKLGKAETFTLNNGLKVIIVENHKLPRASASLRIDNKPVTEGDKIGLSDVMGSLLGRGTANITKDEFNEKVDYLGANISFYSSGANAGSLKKYFSEILSLMADGVKNSQFTQEEFDKEINVTLDNLKSGEKSVTNIARRVESALVYGKNHPFGEFSTKETIGNISLDDVKNHFNTYYKPNNAYLIIVGDVNTKEIKKEVKKLFSDWEKGQIPATSIPSVKNVEHTEIDFINMPNAVQSEISIVNNINLKLGDKDLYAALLANRILGGGGTARLFMNLREDKGYTYGSYSSIRQNRYAGTFRASASVRNTVTDSSVVEIQKEITKIRYQKVSEEELKNAKAEYIGSFVMNVEKPATAAGFALEIAMYNLPKDYYENYLANINAVTLEEVQDAAHNYFKGNKARIIITGKGIDVLKNLENLKYKINYFDKNGNPTTKPEMKKPIAAGVTKETVLNNYFEAIGGVDKIKSLKSTLVIYEGKAMGNTIKSTEKRTSDKYGNEISMGGNVMMKVVMSKDGVNANNQPMSKEMADEMTHTLGTFAEIGVLNNPDCKLTGIETVNGKEVYVISRKGKTISTSFYFDIKTGLKVKEVQTTSMGGKTQNQEAVFSDYKEFNGIKFPTKKSGSLGPQKIEFTLIDAKINEGVSDKDF